MIKYKTDESASDDAYKAMPLLINVTSMIKLQAAFLSPMVSLQEEATLFVVKREWASTHTPRSLLLALIVEVGELSKYIMFKDDKAESSSVSMGE
jgi:hypothetical protein